MAKIEEMLRALRDVEGVYGSFVVSRAGALVAGDLPPIFDAEVFGEVGPRFTRLFDTFRAGGEELEGCLVRYAEHKLYLRAMAWGLIGVLSAVGVNKPALRMGVNLVIRRVDPEVVPSLRPSVTPPPPPVKLPTPLAPPVRAFPEPPSVAPEARDSNPPTSGPVRMYRGRPVTDE